MHQGNYRDKNNPPVGVKITHLTSVVKKRYTVFSSPIRKESPKFYGNPEDNSMRQQFFYLLDSIYDAGVMYSFNPLNCSKVPTMDRHFEAFTFDLFRVTFMRLAAIYKLSATTDTNIILFTFSLTIFINMS
jgi:hypothetical protein